MLGHTFGVLSGFFFPPFPRILRFLIFRSSGAFVLELVIYCRWITEGQFFALLTFSYFWVYITRIHRSLVFEGVPLLRFLVFFTSLFLIAKEAQDDKQCRWITEGQYGALLSFSSLTLTYFLVCITRIHRFLVFEGVPPSVSFFY